MRRTGPPSTPGRLENVAQEAVDGVYWLLERWH